MRVRELLRTATSVLSNAGIAEPDLEASVLLACVLGKARTWLFAYPEAEPGAEARQRFEALVAERAGGEPVAYLTGEREFWSLPLHVSRSTLIPRAETELVVERALALLGPDRARAADLGTGSGAIAAGLASERPAWQVVATDASAAALAVARENFARLGLCNIEARRGDWYDALDDEPFHLLASNPPYIREDDPHLGSGDLSREPRTALASGRDGLDALREIVGDAHHHLASPGWLVVEHGWDQGTEVRALFRSAGFSMIHTHLDLGGRERVTEGCLGCG